MAKSTIRNIHSILSSAFEAAERSERSTGPIGPDLFDEQVAFGGEPVGLTPGRVAVVAGDEGRPSVRSAASHSGAQVSVGDLQAIYTEQHGCRILEHDARGFLMIMNPSAKAQGSRSRGLPDHGDTPVAPQVRKPGYPPSARPVALSRDPKSPGNSSMPD